jgi:signal transduction protein with GAF and PtsI domain
LNTARCEIWRFDASSNHLVLEVSAGSGENDPGEIVITANTEAPVGRASISEQPVIADSAGAEPSFAYPTYLDEQAMVCSMTAVIKADENNRGVLSVHDNHKRQFLPHETNFLQSVADPLSGGCGASSWSWGMHRISVAKHSPGPKIACIKRNAWPRSVPWPRASRTR